MRNKSDLPYSAVSITSKRGVSKSMRKKIGVFSARIIEILELNIPAGAPINIAESNI